MKATHESVDLMVATDLPTNTIRKWIGALSFEERCVGSLKRLAESGTHVDEIVIVDYATKMRPPELGQQRREEHLLSMTAIATEMGAGSLRRAKIDPYAFSSLENALRAEIGTTDGNVVVDITCLTKIHVIAVATVLANVTNKLLVAYSAPENYGRLDESVFQWRDTLIAPLAINAKLYHEDYGRGVLIPGHEADRLVVALAEFSAAGGLILLAESPGRPDLRRLTESRNRQTLDYLLRSHSASWTRRVVSIGELTEIERLVGEQVTQAADHGAPVILFPFGPKPLILVSALVLARNYARSSWFVYPVPHSHDVNYTQGVDRTYWYTTRGRD